MLVKFIVGPISIERVLGKSICRAYLPMAAIYRKIKHIKNKFICLIMKLKTAT
jgi:hypothetical protein